jgi:nicotinamide-nucleotide amidase
MSARIELIATGDELLNGSIVDTNSPWLMAQLDGLGLPAWRKTLVRDDRRELVEALRDAAGRSDVVVVSGGLGPTSDDLTAECAAEAAQVELRFDDAVYAALEARMRSRGLNVTPNNRRQAMVPQGAEVIPNRHGTAPMFELRIQQARFFFLPGVPREYFALATEELLPRLNALASAAPQRRTTLLRCTGIAESMLDQKLGSLTAEYSGLTIAYRTTLPENHAKLTATGPEAQSVLAQAVVEARRRLGLDCFAEGDETFSQAVGMALLSKGASVALAESLTAGRAAALLAETSGASRYLLGGMVVYSEAAKQDLLGVPAQLLAENGAVSLEVAESMAVGARARLHSDYAVACTGLAGPAGDNQTVGRHPVGTVMTALASSSGVTSRRHLFLGDRERIRELAAYATLDALRRHLLTT